jgi:hypothetical protein
MKKDTFFVYENAKILILAIILLSFSGICLLFTQENHIQLMDELFPELNWLVNRDMDGIELPPPSLLEKPKNILEGLEIPPQKPYNRFDRD